MSLAYMVVPVYEILVMKPIFLQFAYCNGVVTAFGWHGKIIILLNTAEIFCSISG